MFLGIEIGGTKLQLGVGDGAGSLAGLWRGNVEPRAGAAGIRTQIQAAFPELLQSSGLRPDEIRCAGVGFGGPVDDRNQRVIKSHQIDGWDDFPLVEWLRQTLGLPAALGNDADVAGLGEALFGAGVGCSPVFYVTVGSGIGGGLVIDREIYRASGRGAGEIGHLRFPIPGSPEKPWAPLEEIASGWAIQSAYRARSGESAATGQDVAQRAAGGDATALEVLAIAREALAEGLCHVIALLCPQRIVLGGGVSLIDESLWLQPIRQLVAQRVFKPFANCTTIVPAALGEEAVVHGAIGLAAKRLASDATWADGEWAV